jgi:hypothetical protein
MNHQLHAAAFVEESLRYDSLLRRQRTQFRHGASDVANRLECARTIEAAIVDEKLWDVGRIGENALAQFGDVPR